MSENKKRQKVLVTGSAGFIGFHLSRILIKEGYQVVGLDNLNDYYDPQLKKDRLLELGIPAEELSDYNILIGSDKFENFGFIKLNLEDRINLPVLFSQEKFYKVVNLAAQAGVRYSLENPAAYIDSNIVGFANILECCRQHGVKHLIYASSSSVYGKNKKVPFSTEDNVDHPISLYAATKKSNELMAHTYSHLYGFPTTGLRFFTVYGPWGRPDMAMFLFTDAIINGRPIKVFNNGDQERDFTYIDDIVAGVVKIVNKKNSHGYSLYNIGNSEPVNLLKFIEEIEKKLGKSAQKEMYPMQPGDVERTWADVKSLKRNFEYKPDTTISKGVEEFVNWYKTYYLE
ncbi:NAD-dependent epimerase [Salinimicrobium sp. MT39]|uniref:NAD-dependent epimerase n=1 Tax=Salinimicrobium profundisediminis TaxID=2994553 RepID=A0A9X3I0E2_9FLAO|nr:NAD-dependent epimerase [Salinimicrobium profundisediminis]MCX2837920.1 NAD-dependent epimerase [Salinimicrobium profundisediminis]